MHREWLSVILPTYNGAAHVRAALNSILMQQQNDRDIDVVVIDDGSTDETVSIVEAYSRSLPVRIVERKHTGNWVANTNMGLSMARGEYVSFLHQDDFWLPKRLKTLRPLLAAARSVSMALHPSWYVDQEGRRLGLWRCPLPNAEPVNSAQVIQRLLVQNFISIPAAIFRRNAAFAVGGMDESLWYTADWDFWLKLANTGQVLYISNPLACFRVHARSQTLRRSANPDFRGQLETVLQRHLPAWEAQHPGKQIVGKIARFSVELNVALAGYYRGRERLPLRQLLSQWLTLGPKGWHWFLRDSRIIERIMARLHSVGPGVATKRER